jgi:hypothetical protein
MNKFDFDKNESDGRNIPPLHKPITPPNFPMAWRHWQAVVTDRDKLRHSLSSKRQAKSIQNQWFELKGTSGNLISPGEAFAGRIDEPCGRA